MPDFFVCRSQFAMLGWVVDVDRQQRKPIRPADLAPGFTTRSTSSKFVVVLLALWLFSISGGGIEKVDQCDMTIAGPSQEVVILNGVVTGIRKPRPECNSGVGIVAAA